MKMDQPPMNNKSEGELAEQYSKTGGKGKLMNWIRKHGTKAGAVAGMGAVATGASAMNPAQQADAMFAKGVPGVHASIEDQKTIEDDYEKGEKAEMTSIGVSLDKDGNIDETGASPVYSQQTYSFSNGDKFVLYVAKDGDDKGMAYHKAGGKLKPIAIFDPVGAAIGPDGTFVLKPRFDTNQYLKIPKSEVLP